jgi:hypothetical protein
MHFRLKLDQKGFALIIVQKFWALIDSKCLPKPFLNKNLKYIAENVLTFEMILGTGRF